MKKIKISHIAWTFQLDGENYGNKFKTINVSIHDIEKVGMLIGKNISLSLREIINKKKGTL
jgi:hypothetical protein